MQPTLSSFLKKFILSASLVGVFGASAAPLAMAQVTSTNGGAVQGTITDATGAVVPGVDVTITNTDTGSVNKTKADSAGFYSVGPLNPGNYTLLLTAQGFQKLSVKTVVRTGTATSGNFKLAIGESSVTVEVNAGAVQINTEQAGVTGVITRQEIDSLPVNGRNILDFAQLQPGVQIQAGGSNDGGFDPTKAGYSALSFNGVSGRTTRILLDGQDVTDETVGTTIFNISQGSVGEIEVSRATNDVSADITSSGSVLMSTRSGTNGLHGELFYNFQDQRAGAATFQDSSDPFQRNQFGGSVGGPLIKDKLFFFANAERLKQDQSAPASLADAFLSIQKQFPNIASPDRDTYSSGRLDYNGPWSTHFFVRANYEANAFATGSQYSTYANRDNAPGIAGGADFARGHFTHSFRISYEKFHNLIADTTNGNSGIYNPIPGLGIEDTDGAGIQTGPNDNAPQQTYQSDKQFRYDGSWVKGQHSIRYGASLNRIQGGGLAAFFGYGPLVEVNSSTALTACPATGNNCDPTTDFTPAKIYVSNGQGYASETPGFGLPGGGQSDWRTGFYLTDSWKIRPTFTLILGARYDRDTGRTNSDVAPIPCSAIIAANFDFSGGTQPCTGNTPLLDQWGPNFGGRVAQPNRNLAPQIGFTYAPAVLNNKTVFRGGFGVFFESNVFNNVQFDRAGRLQTGEFASYPSICNGGTYSYPINGKLVTQTSTGVSLQTICNESVAAGAAAVLQLQTDARAGGTTAAANPSFIGANLYTPGGVDMYAGNYQSPYSLNFNVGFQQELRPGLVASVDYVHIGTFRIAQTIDANHVGDSRYFNPAVGKAAIAATLTACGATSINAALAPAGCPGLHPAVPGGPPAGAATISDFASQGLDSGVSVNGGAPSSINGGTPSAFPGANPNVGQGTFALPQGKSGYDGLQMSLRYQAAHPAPGIVSANFIASYAYSRAISTTSENGISTADSFFAPPSYNNRLPGTVMGYAGLDRTHIFSVGGSARVKYGLKVGLIAHFDSAVPTNMRIDTQGAKAGEIFRSDVDGDGQTGDLLPGTEPGAYMRKVKPGNLNSFISNYNTQFANTLTPAGQALVAAGLFTQAQMVAAKAIVPALATVGGSPYANPILRTLDMNFSYPIVLHRFREGLSIEPGVAIYNIGNLANYNALSNETSGTVMIAGNVAAGDVNGPGDFAAYNSQRVSRRTGTFDQGAPRATEFQLKFNF